MKCPRDDTALQPFMVEAHIQVDRCSTCRGVWLDKGELEQIQQTIERDHGKLALSGPDPVQAAFEQARQERQGPARCPRCGSEMELREYGYNSQVMIDTCPEGCGVWLDDGELQRLEVFYERGQADNPLPVTWRLWAGVVSVFRKGKRAKRSS
jgi:Zn-finger nucleic acid-binding protein